MSMSTEPTNTDRSSSINSEGLDATAPESRTLVWVALGLGGLAFLLDAAAGALASRELGGMLWIALTAAFLGLGGLIAGGIARGTCAATKGKAECWHKLACF